MHYLFLFSLVIFVITKLKRYHFRITNTQYSHQWKQICQSFIQWNVNFFFNPIIVITQFLILESMDYEIYARFAR